MRRSLWVSFLALFGLQPKRRRTRRRIRTYVAIGPTCDGWPLWLPQGDSTIRVTTSSTFADGQADAAWLVRSTRTPQELCEHAELSLHGAGRIVVLEVSQRWATLHASNVVEWLQER